MHDPYACNVSNFTRLLTRSLKILLQGAVSLQQLSAFCVCIINAWS